jgi:hypothetical protein
MTTKLKSVYVVRAGGECKGMVYHEIVIQLMVDRSSLNVEHGSRQYRENRCKFGSRLQHDELASGSDNVVSQCARLRKKVSWWSRSHV